MSDKPRKFVSGACPKCGALGRKLVNPAWLRFVRTRAGVQLREMARQAGCSAAFVCDVEHGRRNCNEALMARYNDLPLA